MRLALAALLFASATAGAVVPKVTTRPVADTLLALPAAGLGKPLRTHVEPRFGRVALPGAWHAAFDPATGVPTKIWGEGLPAFGANASASTAEILARNALAQYLEMLAPGAALADFHLASNQTDGAIRTVGFFQFKDGLRVVGGQVSFEFKHDRLFVIGSQALPHVVATSPATKLARSAMISRATGELRAAVALPAAPVAVLGGDVILPLVADGAVLGYRVVSPLEIDGGADGRYLAYADAAGQVLALQQRNRFASGTLDALGIDRWKGNPRPTKPMPYDDVTIGGSPTVSSATGLLTFDGTAATIMPSVTGTFAAIVNKADAGTAATTTLQLPAGGTAVWDASAVIEDDAQVNAYVNVNVVKDFVRAHVDSKMATLDDQITVFTNIAMDCNAFFDGKSINLFHATATCENTALVEDVIFHEFGHDLHENEIIAGVGSFDGAMSEGAGDTLAVNIINDSGMGRGFFFNNQPLRELDPVGKEWIWPKDIGEIHHTGMIYGGALWDLRKAMIAQYGYAAGRDKLLQLYLGTLRRAVDIPTSLIEALAQDDDDGNLENGTPNECMIRDAYGRHGLRTVNGTVDAPGALDANALSTLVTIGVTGLSTRCGGDVVDHATLAWAPSYTGQPAAGQVDATTIDTASFYAQLPLALDEVVIYQAQIDFVDGSVFTLPDNRADPYYQTYQGHTKALYCTSMDTDPFQEGWTTGTSDGTPSPWSWGVPTSGATDPHAAYSGTHVLAQVLDGDYNPMSYSFVQLPPIDVGNYSDVRLQYRRWLGVEDSHFDQARILTNDNVAWVNFTENNGDASARQHIDREWRFHDVPLSSHFTGRELNLKFDLKSDPGLQLGGWTIDDLCVVANTKSICGDGIKSAFEQCDDGANNSDAADACRTTCRAPTCGDLIVDSTEQCDAGPDGDATCGKDCQLVAATDGGGGCSTGGSSGSLLLAALVALALSTSGASSRTTRRRSIRRSDRSRSGSRRRTAC